MKAIDEDYLIEFRNYLGRLGKFISNNTFLIRTAINNSLDINQLFNGEIPKNIAVYHKEIRNNAF